MTPTKTLNKNQQTNRGKKMSRSLVLKWHKKLVMDNTLRSSNRHWLRNVEAQVER
jgi:hypothetical protein